MTNEFAPEVRQLPEVAYYYPNQYWRNIDWAKNLILYFDGIANLIPDYMHDHLSKDDLAVIEGLKEENLFTVLSPETLVDRDVARDLTTILAEIIDTGRLDRLRNRELPFGSLSMSRLGFSGDHELAQIVLDMLKERGLAGDTEDGRSIPMDVTVRHLILVLLAQLLRKKGPALGVELCPATDQPRIVQALDTFLSEPGMPTAGHVVAFDMVEIGVDMGSVAIDEILSFRREHYPEFRRYRIDVRGFLHELSVMSEAERAEKFADRKATIDEMTAAIHSRTAKLSKKAGAFSLGLIGTSVGAVAGYSVGGPEGAVLGGAAAAKAVGDGLKIAGMLVGGVSESQPNLGTFSYLFRSLRTM